MIKGLRLTCIFILVLLFSSCSNSSSTFSSSVEPLTNQDETQELQQKIQLLQSEKQSLQSQIDSLQSVWTTDLTGDGKNETITAPPWPTPASLYEYGGSLKVELADGSILIDEKSGILGVVGVYNVGANTPVLLTLQWGGGSMGNYYGAYLYDSDDHNLKKLEWDQYEVAIGLLDNNEGKTGSIVIKDRGLKSDGGYQPFYQQWVYKDGQMTVVKKWDAPE